MAKVWPVRLRLSRAKGFDLKAHSHAMNGLPAINAARPGKLGNPFIVGLDGSRADCVRKHQTLVFEGLIQRSLPLERQAELKAYLENISTHLQLGDYRDHNIACWCELPQPGHADCCHGSTLIDVFNSP